LLCDSTLGSAAGFPVFGFFSASTPGGIAISEGFTTSPVSTGAGKTMLAGFTFFKPSGRDDPPFSSDFAPFVAFFQDIRSFPTSTAGTISTVLAISNARNASSSTSFTKGALVAGICVNRAFTNAGKPGIPIFGTLSHAFFETPFAKRPCSIFTKVSPLRPVYFALSASRSGGNKKP
jgi:hypothetical protein